MNRRLRELESEIKDYQHLLNESTTISECLIYQGKIESLKREEKRILERYEEEECNNDCT